ncbi:hypothetical protein AHiyo8_60210 [Arthrobacter sp. Hiyo8]|nr:hypothetical protein AHiyo8_60210 [Arthrobacter sp. Hiyo8]
MRRGAWCTAWQNSRVMSRGKPQKPSGRRHAAGSPGLLLAVPLLLAGLVAGCTAPAPTVSRSTGFHRPPPRLQPAPPPPSHPVLATPRHRLRSARHCRAEADHGVRTQDDCRGNPKPAQDALRSQLVSAGIADSAVEVSASKTPTGLDVDAIEAAARLDKDCVMGEIRDGQVSVSVLPVLASGKCFVGDSR